MPPEKDRRSRSSMRNAEIHNEDGGEEEEEGGGG